MKPDVHCARREPDDIDPRLEEAVRVAVALGAVLVLLLPAARGIDAAIGWLPLWLLAMPLTAWWALHRFRWPQPRQPTLRSLPLRRRQGAQARSRQRPVARPALPRAA